MTVLPVHTHICLNILTETINASITIDGIPEEIPNGCMLSEVLQLYHYSSLLDDTATNVIDNMFYAD